MRNSIITFVSLLPIILSNSDITLEDYLFQRLKDEKNVITKVEFREKMVSCIDEFLQLIRLPQHVIKEEELMFRKIIKKFISLYKIEYLDMQEHNQYMLKRFIDFERTYRREIYIELMEMLGYFKRNLTESTIEHILEHPYKFDLTILNWE